MFEAELEARGFGYRIDPESRRHVVSVPNGEVVVSLDNLDRDLSASPDAPDRVRRFVDTIVQARSGYELQVAGLY